MAVLFVQGCASGTDIYVDWRLYLHDLKCGFNVIFLSALINAIR